MLAVNNNNNVNFQARLATRGIAGSKARWNNISKIFQEKTPNIDDIHSIALSGSFSKGLEVKYGEMYYTLTQNGSKLLKDLSDTKIAEKLIKIMKLGKTPMDVILDKSIPYENWFKEMASRHKAILKRDTLLQKNLVSKHLY